MKTNHAKARLGALTLACLPILGGCGLKDYFPDPAAQAKKAQDEAAAIGGACRQSGRSLEECFDRQSKVDKAGALKGWREMDEYMRENKLDPQAPKEEPKPAKASKGDKQEKGKEDAKEEPKKDEASDEG